MVRHLTPLLFAALIVIASAGPLAAQGTPAPAAGSILAGLGYPELRIVVTDAGSQVPEEAPAGRTLIALDNQSGMVSDVNILQLPEGITLDDLNALMTAEGGEPPAWFADIDSLGGFNVAPGATGHAVVDLQPGEWSIGVGDFNPYTLLTVTGEAATGADDPPSDLALDVHEFTLSVPERLPAGPQVWHVANSGEQLHEIQLIRTPELLTIEQVLTILSLPEGEPLPEGVPDPSTFEFVPEGAKSMSPGREIWVEMDLQPGSYVAICSNADTETGQPHAALGETSIFTVGDGATPVS